MFRLVCLIRREVERGGAEVVGCAFAIELTFLEGRARLAPRECFSVIEYHDEN